MVQLWMSPRDICALAATAVARAKMQEKLAAHMSLRIDSPEALFAVTTFHKFYQESFEQCVVAQGAAADQHRLIEAPELIYHMLKALGFCTFVDEEGIERMRQDEQGRPICAWLTDVRTAWAKAIPEPWEMRLNPVYAPFLPLRVLAYKVADLAYIKATSEGMKDVQRELEEMRPKKTALAYGGIRFSDYSHNFFAWNSIHDALVGDVAWSYRALENARAIATQPSPTQANAAAGRLTGLLESARRAQLFLERGLFTSRQVLGVPSEARVWDTGRLEYFKLDVAPPERNRVSARDTAAALWRQTFRTFLEQKWVPLLQALLREAKGLEETALGSAVPPPSPSSSPRSSPLPSPVLPRKTAFRSMRSNVSQPGGSAGSNASHPTRSGSLTSLTSTISGTPSANTEDKSPRISDSAPPRRQLWEEDVCFLQHERRKEECTSDVACEVRGEMCREKPKESESVVKVFGTIAEARKHPRKNKPPSRLSSYELARQVEERPPSSFRQRRLAVQDTKRLPSEDDGRRSPECDGLKQGACKRSRECAWDRGVCSPRSQAVPVSQSVARKAGPRRSECLSLSEESCNGHFDCEWDKAGNACAQTQVPTQDISGFRPRPMRRPDTAERFILASRDAARFTERGFGGCDALKRTSCRRNEACSWNTDNKTCSARSPVASSSQAAFDPTPEQIAPRSPAPTVSRTDRASDNSR